METPEPEPAVRTGGGASYLLQPQRVVLHDALQVLQLLGGPLSVHGRRVSLCNTPMLLRLRRWPPALTPVQLRQEEGVAAVAVLDAMQPPPLL